MKTRSGILLGLALAFPLLSPSRADARGGLLLITHGDRIGHVGDGPTQELKGSKVGYKYSYFGVFWVDLWTWGGSYCVYERTGFRPIQPPLAASLLGIKEDELSPPLLYRFPLGLLIGGSILGLMALVGLFQSMGARRQQKAADRAAEQMQDPNYRRAVEVMNEEYARLGQAAEGRESDPLGGIDEKERIRSAFDAGVHHLVQNGVDRAEAERDLRSLTNP